MEVVLLFAALVIIACILFNKLSDRIGVPALLAFILLGMVCGVDGIFHIDFDNFPAAENAATVALIFIMFYGGFGTNWAAARRVAGRAVILSTAGVVLTASVTAVLCRYLLRVSWVYGFLIGSVLASTDAASVFSILRSKRLNLKDNTASLLEVESGSNDPAAYMMTVVVTALITGSGELNIPLLLIKQIAFGVGFGVILALAGRAFLNRFSFSPGFAAIFVLAMALLSYALPAFFGGNGFLSAYLVGLIVGNSDLPKKRELVHFFDGITGLMQMVLFFLLGLLCTPSQLPKVLPEALAVALILTVVARPAAVTALLLPFGARHPQRALVSWAGLRGAASIVFAVMATTRIGAANMEVDIFSLVFSVVIFSILLQGTLLPKVAERTGMIGGDEDVMRTFNDYSAETPVQFIQFEVPEQHKWAGRKLRDMTLPPDTLLVLLQRKKQPAGGAGEKALRKLHLRESYENIAPNGDTVILAGDRLTLSAKTPVQIQGVRLREQFVDARSAGKPVSALPLPAGELIILIERGSEVIIPKGNTTLRRGDKLVLYHAEDARRAESLFPAKKAVLFCLPLPNFLNQEQKPLSCTEPRLFLSFHISISQKSTRSFSSSGTGANLILFFKAKAL